MVCQLRCLRRRRHTIIPTPYIHHVSFNFPTPLFCLRYYSKLTNDFHVNKRVCGEVAIVPSKRMRNKIAGFITHLMKRIQKGPVRGISLKLQEEERERRMDFVPEKSALDTDITIDSDTKDMLESFSAGMMSRIPHQVVGR